MKGKNVLLLSLIVMLVLVAGNVFAKIAGPGDEDFFFKEGNFYIRNSLAEHYDVDVLSDFDKSSELPISVVIVESYLDYLYFNHSEYGLNGSDVIIIQPLNTSSPGSDGYRYYLDSGFFEYINNGTQNDSGMYASDFVKEVYNETKRLIKDSEKFQNFDTSDSSVNNSLSIVTLASMFSVFKIQYEMSQAAGDMMSSAEEFLENMEKTKNSFMTFGPYGYCEKEGNEPENLYELFAEVSGEYDYAVFKVLRDFDVCLPVNVESEEQEYIDVSRDQVLKQLSQLNYLFNKQLNFEIADKINSQGEAEIERVAVEDTFTEDVLYVVASNPGKFSAVLDKLGKNKDVFSSGELDFQYIFAAPQLFLSDEFYTFLEEHTDKGNRDLKELINHNLNADYEIVNNVVSQFGSGWTIEHTYKLLDLMDEYAVRGEIAMEAIANFMTAFRGEYDADSFLTTFPYFASKFQTSFYRGTNNIKTGFDKFGFESLSDYFEFLDENIPVAVIEEMGLNDYLYFGGDISEFKSIIENYPYVDYEKVNRYFDMQLIEKCPLIGYYGFSDDTFRLLANADLTEEELAKFVCGELTDDIYFDSTVVDGFAYWDEKILAKMQENPWSVISIKEVPSDFSDVEAFVEGEVADRIRMFNFLTDEYSVSSESEIAADVVFNWNKNVLGLLQKIDPSFEWVDVSEDFDDPFSYPNLGLSFEERSGSGAFEEGNDYFEYLNEDMPSTMCLELIYENGLDHDGKFGKLISSGYLTEASCPLYLMTVESSSTESVSEFTSLIYNVRKLTEEYIRRPEYQRGEIMFDSPNQRYRVFGERVLQYTLLKHVLLPELIDSEEISDKDVNEVFRILAPDVVPYYHLAPSIFAVDYTYGNYQQGVHPALLRLADLREDYDLSSFHTLDDVKSFLLNFRAAFKDYIESISTRGSSSISSDTLQLAFFSYFDLKPFYDMVLPRDGSKFPINKDHFVMAENGMVSKDLLDLLFKLISVGESKIKLADYDRFWIKLAEGTSNVARTVSVFFGQVGKWLWLIPAAPVEAYNFYAGGGSLMEGQDTFRQDLSEVYAENYATKAMTGRVPSRTLKTWVFANPTSAQIINRYEDEFYTYVLNHYVLTSMFNDRWECENLNDPWFEIFVQRNELGIDFNEINRLFSLTKYISPTCDVNALFGDDTIREYFNPDRTDRDNLYEQRTAHIPRRILSLFNSYRFNEMVRAPVVDNSIILSLLEDVKEKDILLGNAMNVVAISLEEYVAAEEAKKGIRNAQNILYEKLDLIRGIPYSTKVLVYKHTPQDLFSNSRSFDDFFVDWQDVGGLSGYRFGVGLTAQKQNFLRALEDFPGPSVSVIVSGHGTPFALYDGNSFLSYRELAKAIYDADKKSGGAVTYNLLLFACNSYQFAKNLLQELYQLYGSENIPINIIYTTGKDSYLASRQVIDLLNAHLNKDKALSLSDLLEMNAVSMGYKPHEPISYDFGLFVKGKGKMQEIANAVFEDQGVKV